MFTTKKDSALGWAHSNGRIQVYTVRQFSRSNNIKILLKIVHCDQMMVDLNLSSVKPEKDAHIERNLVRTAAFYKSRWSVGYERNSTPLGKETQHKESAH